MIVALPCEAMRYHSAYNYNQTNDRATYLVVLDRSYYDPLMLA